MKKTLLTVVLLMSILMLAACGGSNNDKNDNASKENDANASEGSDEIVAWAWDPKFNIAALETAEEYYDGEASLKVIENAQDDIVSKLNTSLGSGAMKGLPNIVLIEDYRAQSFIKSYPDAFYALDDYIDSADFADYKVEPTQVDGVQYGVPFDSGTTGLYVRTDIFEEAGYKIDDLQDITWDDYIEIGKEIKEKTGTNLLTLDPNDLGQIRFMMQSAGKWYVEEDGETPSFENNEGLKEAFKVYKEMMDADIVKVVSDWSQFVGAFNSGDVASLPTGNWITPSVKAEESQSGDWAVVPLPTLDLPESVHASNLGGSSWYVLNVDGKEAAADFLSETFGSNEELYADLVENIGAIGTYLPAHDQDAFKAEDDFFDGQRIIEDFTEWTEEIPAVNYGLNTHSLEDVAVQAMQGYLNGQELDDVLKNAQQQAEN